MSRPLIRGLEEVYAPLLGDSSLWDLLLTPDVVVDQSWLVVTNTLLVGGTAVVAFPVPPMNRTTCIFDAV